MKKYECKTLGCGREFEAVLPTDYCAACQTAQAGFHNIGSVPLLDESIAHSVGLCDLPQEGRLHSHYYKNVEGLTEVDVYRILDLFDVRSSCLQHIVKKALCAGDRGHKDYERDLLDIRDTIDRALEMIAEDHRRNHQRAA